MRRAMILEVTQPAGEPAMTGRPIREDDASALAELMLAAYRGTIDDEGETIDDARGEIEGLFDGKYGELLPECSFVVERDGAIVSTCLVTLFRGAPLVAFSMTDPGWKRMGLGRGCLLMSIRALHENGHSVLRLVVTPGNTPAERLYEHLGFRDDGDPAG